VRGFFEAAANAIDGDVDARDEVVQGVRWAMGRRRGGGLQDEARQGREDAGFEPKGEFRTSS
ncbi:MAG: hypothetical protein ACC662_08675, partial [Planctomycetota bacterium]